MPSPPPPAASRLRNEYPWSSPAANYSLWTLQWLLALLFVFTGTIKLILPIAELTKQVPLPGLFLRFIAVAELFGAVGLILPWLLKIRRYLTALAACGLVVIMVGATVVSFLYVGVATALMPLTVGILLLLVTYGRSSFSSPATKLAPPVDFAPPRSTY